MDSLHRFAEYNGLRAVVYGSVAAIHNAETLECLATFQGFDAQTNAWRFVQERSPKRWSEIATELKLFPYYRGKRGKK